MARRPDKNPQPLMRMLKSDSRIRIRPLGNRTSFADLYHAMLRASWPLLFLLFWVSFAAFNLLFGWLYWLEPGGIGIVGQPIAGGRFWQSVVFSVDTMATVGYGNMYAVSGYANIVATIEIALGILFVALLTGMAFARFSRPTARILFSKVAVVVTVDGVPTLMLRCANQRHNLIFEASATMSLVTDENVGGLTMRRFHDLELARRTNPVFALTWTIMHPITVDSPLNEWVAKRAVPDGADVIVVVSGTDDRTGHTMYGRWAYSGDDIRWDSRFVDILGKADDGVRTIDYRRFHDVTATPDQTDPEPIVKTSRSLRG